MSISWVITFTNAHCCTVDEYKHLGCQSDKIRRRRDSTWGPLDYEAKTLPLDQQVKLFWHSNMELNLVCIVIWAFIERIFMIDITFCKSSEIFNSKLFKISQSPVRFDFFPTKYSLMPSYVLNPRMVPLGAPCKTIALKTAFYIGNLTNLWKSVLNLCAKLVFSLCFVAKKSIL